MSGNTGRRLDAHALFSATAWSPWPLTVRTRYLLAIALELLADAIAEDLDDASPRATAPANSPLAYCLPLFPLVTRAQSVEWWRKVEKAARRMSAAIATGEQWNPRTPAEEAVVFLAIEEWVEDAVELCQKDSALASAYARLRKDRDGDLAWDEVLRALTGDEDVAQLWDPSRDGAEDPSAPSNIVLGMGDYRPAAWHEPFKRHREDPDDASGLY